MDPARGVERGDASGSGQSAWPASISGIAVGILTTLLGCMSFVFAITGDGEIMLVGLLSLLWGVAPAVSGVIAFRSLRAAALGLIATALPAAHLAVCVVTMRQRTD